MLIPLGERPACGNHEAGVGGGGLERLGVPSVECALYCPSVVTAAEQREHPVAVMGQIGMQPHPTTITAAIQSRDLVMILRRRPAIDAQVPFAAELDRGIANVDADPLAATRAQSPQLAGCQSRGGNGRLRCGADGK